MDKTNETCVQRVKVIFFHPSSQTSGRWSTRIPLLSRLNRKTEGTAGGGETDLKLKKINAMIGTFQNAHKDWSIYESGNHIVLETTTFDFAKISTLLEKGGFLHSDYDLRVEYERKWGML